MRLLHVARSGARTDVTELMSRCVWSGDYAQAARTLEVKLLSNAPDIYLPKVSVDNGEMLLLYADSGAELFRGYVFRNEGSAQPGEKTCLAYDGLVYLVRSDITRNWKNATAEEITRDVCAEFGVEVGELTDSGGAPLSFPWVGKSAYKAVMAAWTKVSDAGEGRMFQPVMYKGKLHVAARGESVCARELTGRGEITDAEYASSIEDAVDRVRIVDDAGAVVGGVENAEDILKYGTLQKTYKRDKNKDAKTEAEKLLKGVENTASLSDFAGGDDCLDMISGNAVYINEPATGLVGKFYIDTDAHTFADGQHMVGLGLNFRLAMDREEADAEKAQKTAKKTSGAGSKAVGNTDIWEKYDKQWKEAHGW